MAARHWTQEQRREQARRIMTTQPWRWSTGPRTQEGKQRVSKNADQGGIRPKLRALVKEVNQMLDECRSNPAGHL